jgi:DNA end-binding protein Ku
VPEWEDAAEAQDVVARSFWSGTITFGLVSVPVALYAAHRSDRVSLRMVSPEGTPLTRRYFTSRDDRALDADDIVRGYEIEKGRFVIVDDDELERLAPERTRDIDLRQFVKLSEIDPMYFERAYYLVPNGQSTKAYRLLARVMEETGRAGVATFVMRAREYLVAIIAENGILRAETLRFADELRTPESIGLPEPGEADAAEVKRMDREIGKRVEQRLPKSDLEDRSAERLMKVIQKKLRAGDDVVHAEEGTVERETDVIDLMEILKRRLQGEQEDAAAAAAEAPKPARKTAKRSAAAKRPARTSAANSTARKTASKSAARKGSSKTAASKKSAAKKSAAKKSTAKKSASRKAA